MAKVVKITKKLIFDYNFGEKFKMPSGITQFDKDRLYWGSQHGNEKFFPKGKRSRSYWSIKDKNEFVDFVFKKINE